MANDFNDLLENTKPPKKEKGVEKTIYFAKIACKEFEQFGLFGNSRKVDLLTILNNSFDTSNRNYNAKDNNFTFTCDSQNYAISIIEQTDKFVFGKISTEKEFNDFLEEYQDGQNAKKLTSIIIKYFTFFYIDIEKKALVYIGQKGLKNINKLFMKYIEEFTKEQVIIEFLGDSKLIEKVEKSTKLKSIEFQLADNGEVSKSLDKTLQWNRDMNLFEIQIKVKTPTKSLIKEIISDKQSCVKIKNPILTLQDESFNEYISHLFTSHFTVKDILNPSEIDLDKFETIKRRLIAAMNKYMG